MKSEFMQLDFVKIKSFENDVHHALNVKRKSKFFIENRKQEKYFTYSIHCNVHRNIHLYSYKSRDDHYQHCMNQRFQSTGNVYIRPRDQRNDRICHDNSCVHRTGKAMEKSFNQKNRKR